MKTILYNKTTNEVKHHAKEGYYKVGAKLAKDNPDLLPEPWVELEQLEAITPPIEANEYLERGLPEIDLDNKTYKPITYIVKSKTAEQIALEEFGYSEYSIRLDISGDVIFTSMGSAYRSWLADKGYPVEIQEDDSYRVWLNEINPAHQPYIDGLVAANKLTIVKNPSNEQV